MELSSLAVKLFSFCYSQVFSESKVVRLQAEVFVLRKDQSKVCSDTWSADVNRQANNILIPKRAVIDVRSHRIFKCWLSPLMTTFEPLFADTAITPRDSKFRQPHSSKPQSRHGGIPKITEVSCLCKKYNAVDYRLVWVRLVQQVAVCVCVWVSEWVSECRCCVNTFCVIVG